MFLSPERELKRIQCTPVSHASPDTLRKKVRNSRKTIQTLHKENLKLQRIVSSMSTEQQETVNVDEDFRRLIQSMFQDGHKLESNQKTRMKNIIIDCLNDNLQKGEIPQDQIQSSVDEVVNFMFENMTNLFHELNQNKKQVRFSSSAMKLYIGLYTNSYGAFRDFKAASVFPIPSRSTMKTYIGKTSNLEEEDDTLYDQLQEGSIVQLLCDEIKVRQGLTYNTKTNKVIGFAHCDDLKKLVKKVLHDNDNPSLTSHYNQWGARTTDNQYMPLSFFSNDGSLDAHESLRQMLSVTLRCSLRKVIVAGVIGDAAPSISGMYTLMRQSVPIPKYDLKLSKDICTVPHPYWKSLKVAMSLCSGHGMKRTRGQLFSSSRNGSRNFCIDGIFFGWQVILDIYDYDQKDLFPKTLLDQTSIQPIGRRAMNMKGDQLLHSVHIIILILI